MSAYAVQVQENIFNENERKYKCCCGCCHSRSGTLAIGVLDALGLGGLLYRFAELYFILSEEEETTWYSLVLLGISGVLFIWCVIAVLCLFVAVCREKPKLLLPKIFLQIATALFVSLLIVCCVLGATTQASEIVPQLERLLNYRATLKHISTGDNTADNIVAVFLWFIAIALTIYVLVEIWFLCVLRSCYIYLKDKAAWAQSHGVTNSEQPVQYTQVPTSAPLQEYGFPAQGQAPPAYPMQMYGDQQQPNVSYQGHQRGLYPNVDSMKI